MPQDQAARGVERHAAAGDEAELGVRDLALTQILFIVGLTWIGVAGKLGPAAVDTGDPGLEKEAWVSQTLLEWGSCGKLAYVDGMPAGFVMYAPPAYVPLRA